MTGGGVPETGAAVRAATAARAGWGALDPADRSERLFDLADALGALSDQLTADLATTAVTSGSSPSRDVATALDRVRWFAGWADKLQHLGATGPTVLGPHRATVARVPVGVVGCTVPRTGDLVALVGALLPALTVGTTVVAVLPVHLDRAAATVRTAVGRALPPDVACLVVRADPGPDGGAHPPGTVPVSVAGEPPQPADLLACTTTRTVWTAVGP